jgi:hypothetical protein
MDKRRWVAPLLVVLHLLVLGGSVAAAQVTAGDGAAGDPAIAVNKTSVSPGEGVVVTLTDWPGRAVTISVCGNNALRGSQDCNMVESETESLSRDGSPSLAALPVGLPPVHCPCVLRASSRTNDIVLFAPIEIVGHPTGPLIEPPGFKPLSIDVDLARAPAGIVTGLRSALGGPTPYAVTVTVRNLTGGPLSGVTVSGAVQRGGGSDAAGVKFEPAGDLAAGETWRKTETVTLPAPAVGKFKLVATASGGGSPVEAQDSIRRLPWLFVVVVLVFGADVTAIAVRKWQKVQAERTGDPDGEDPADEDDDTLVHAPVFG